mmetsp:Transcript_495/g.1704  ORF Transcript_495/g.1704 Transcript_495/m.1704 type:complete len:126 (-) Transcript_495:106-483(-)|eukprot:CAMPEP_0198736620 /NCGR_PEP_ID=MMETSP1475-20131203/67050_1 /TAXON_ID= ORGANISM="Unidentified sp., Strain CCMP1999" /NCGR_SAMPLE_ID=MMETSP1475 /ASSEMBLY_ACC=CAM_ASM_001111 /LENGTH=125 /DNA_ID=CAMNT_0044500457 /DNA_START=47 /DNA_END=424 /DNA_ORIENTATION=-
MVAGENFDFGNSKATMLKRTHESHWYDIESDNDELGIDRVPKSMPIPQLPFSPKNGKPIEQVVCDGDMCRLVRKTKGTNTDFINSHDEGFLSDNEKDSSFARVALSFKGKKFPVMPRIHHLKSRR